MKTINNLFHVERYHAERERPNAKTVRHIGWAVRDTQNGNDLVEVFRLKSEAKEYAEHLAEYVRFQLGEN